MTQPDSNRASLTSGNGLATDVRVTKSQMYLLPVQTRVPLKFGAETLTHVTCLRVRMTVQDRAGQIAEGWGETPLSVQWAWPSSLSHDARLSSMIAFAKSCNAAWPEVDDYGHAMELGYDFIRKQLPERLAEHQAAGDSAEPMPLLAALICASAFDIALHDAYGNACDRDIYQTYSRDFMNCDLSDFLTPDDQAVTFDGKYPQDFFVSETPTSLPAWHLVGGLDPIAPSELAGDEPDDGVPVLLNDWIQRDGLKYLKIKLRGNDSEWDYQRLVQVGKVAAKHNVTALTSDFNCQVHDPAYVNEILDRLAKEHPSIFDDLLYVEQPFPYELEQNRIDVHSVSGRKPLFLDESAHDWQHVRLGRQLGWTGVALKTCKTQTGALLSHCWARAHGMQIMVQDLTNPMLAAIPHVRLAAHVGTIGGVETNAMQFYPAASDTEAVIHPGIYRRRDGQVDLSTISGPGFGYRIDEIARVMPEPTAEN
ncbi:enolase C-terminal domain-like protein [Neorhodopirellula lusitana]|uniref:enolase C-terminal domain-like protein n=1 Tax=Neorhodopirellula lusitana TaxID=445327 RepID=UPI00384F1D52